MDLSDKTPDELRKMGLEAVIKLAFEGETYSVPNLVKDKYGNSVELTEVTRDSLTGNLVSRKVVTWDYYDDKAGTVKDISVQVGNRKQVITHTLDGKQPTARQFIVAEPKILGDVIYGATAGMVIEATSGVVSSIKDTIVKIFRG